MSLAAVERGVQPFPSGRESNLINAREVFASGKRQEYFDHLPNIFLAQQTLLGRDFAPNLFVARAAEETLDRIAAPLKYGGATAGLIVLSSVLAACARPGEAPSTITNPPNNPAQVVKCEPEPYAKQIGIPTPVGIGGGPKDVPPPADIIAIRFKIEHCDPITPEEIKRAREFNIQVETTAFVDKAIRDGKIELSQPQEWEKYYKAVSKTEAKEMELKAKEKGEFIFFLPVNPSENPNLTVKISTTTNVKGEIVTLLVLNNVSSKAGITSPVSGDTKTSHFLNNNLGGLYKYAEINNDQGQTLMYIKDPTATPILPESTKSNEDVGAPLYTTTTPATFPAVLDNAEIAVQFLTGGGQRKVSLNNLARIDGKIGFIG